MKKCMVLLLFLALTTNSFFADSFCDQNFNFEDIEQQLCNEEIISQISMKEFILSKGHITHFSNKKIYVVTLATGIQAVLKIVDSQFPRDAIAEVAAYKASRFLGINLVPPTVLYVKNGVIASLQYYVEPSYDLMNNDNYENAKKKVSAQDLANIELFYFIFGQWDRGPSNIIAVEKANNVFFVLIDNAAIGYSQKTRYGDYSFVLSLSHIKFPQTKPCQKNFPFNNARPICPDQIKEKYTFLSENHLKRICQQHHQSGNFVIWNNHFWKQYCFDTPAYTTFYPPHTMEKIQLLSRATLQTFYNNELDFIFSDEYFDDIINRRDQILKAYEESSKKDEVL